MHRLTSAFILGYHGCDHRVGERLLTGTAFKPSKNDYDWLGPGIYFWEANPLRGLEFAEEASKRKTSNISKPFVIGAVIELGLCLDLPSNSKDELRRNLDCAVVRRLHTILETQKLPAIDTLKGVFTEGEPVYPGAGFREKTHIQVAVRNPQCIKGVFRVPQDQLHP